MKIGIVGLGRLGGIFATRLLDGGFDLAVWNRTASKCAPHLARGAVDYPTPSALAAGCDVVLVSMADEAASEETFLGHNGLVATSLKDKVIVETSTLSPSFVRRLAQRVASVGGAFVDAPVLGTVGPAREGKLVVLTGGEPKPIAKVYPALNALSRRIVHVGPVGSGSAMKLVVNMHLATYWHSLAESLAMGRRSGLELEAMLGVLSDSPIATPALAGKIPILLGQSSEVGFDIGGVNKDMSTALTLAEETLVDARTAQAAYSGYKSAIAGGWRDRDVAAIVEALMQRKVVS